jgi:hypothetical protein
VYAHVWIPRYVSHNSRSLVRGYHRKNFILNLGKYVPKFDIAKFYSEEDVRDLLIRDQRLGKHLSSCFSQETNDSYHSVVLMRGHGFTVVRESVAEGL